ncbi:unnamed protein product [Symbiodinium microadriaticum]|nr:unnamed protein product [Symbiodinium microadriaticum]
MGHPEMLRSWELFRHMRQHMFRTHPQLPLKSVVCLVREHEDSGRGRRLVQEDADKVLEIAEDALKAHSRPESLVTFNGTWNGKKATFEKQCRIFDFAVDALYGPTRSTWLRYNVFVYDAGDNVANYMKVDLDCFQMAMDSVGSKNNAKIAVMADGVAVRQVDSTDPRCRCRTGDTRPLVLRAKVPCFCPDERVGAFVEFHGSTVIKNCQGRPWVNVCVDSHAGMTDLLAATVLHEALNVADSHIEDAALPERCESIWSEEVQEFGCAKRRHVKLQQWRNVETPLDLAKAKAFLGFRMVEDPAILCIAGSKGLGSRKPPANDTHGGVELWQSDLEIFGRKYDCREFNASALVVEEPAGMEATTNIADAPKRKAKNLKTDDSHLWMFMCFPADGNCCFQEDTEMRPDADPFTIAGNAGHVATGEDVAGTEEYENATDNGSPSAGVFHADQSQFANDKLSSGGTDFRLKEQLSPALRQEVEQIKADIAAKQALKAAEVGGTLTDVQETDTRAEAQAPPKVGAERGRGASGRAVQAEARPRRQCQVAVFL